MEWRPETWDIIRDLYYSWECGRACAPDICSALVEQGVTVSEQFHQILQQHSHARDIPFTEFVRNLKRSVGSYREHRIPDLGDSTPRRMHVLTFRDIPLTSSEKAPFGTDNNVYIRGIHSNGYEDPVYLSVVRDTISGPKKVHASVPSANDLFKESSARTDIVHPETNLNTVPRHLIASINPITGEERSGETATNKSISLPSVRRQLENTSILSGKIAGLSPIGNEEEPSEMQRRHFVDFNKESPVADDISVDTCSLETLSIADNNILSHDSTRPVERYRPHTRVIASKLTPNCPFATDEDDLLHLRNELHSTPLGKPYLLPHATH